MSDRRAKLLRELMLDGVGVAGAVLVVAGVAAWSVPAAMIVAGAAMVAVSAKGARRWAS